MPWTLISSDYSTVTGTSQKFSSLTMVAGNQYRLTSSVDCYFKVGPAATVTASVADGNHFLAAGASVVVALKDTNDTVAIIQASVSGVATLSLIEPGDIS